MDDLFREKPIRKPRELTDEELARELRNGRLRMEPGQLLRGLIAFLTQKMPSPADTRHELFTIGSQIVTQTTHMWKELDGSDEANLHKPAIIYMKAIGQEIKKMGEDQHLRNWGEASDRLKHLKDSYNKEMSKQLRTMLRNIER